MVKREVLRGATVAVAAAIMTTSMSLANPMVVEAKVKPAKTVAMFTEIPEYVDDDYIPPAGYEVIDNKVVPIGGGAAINGSTVTATAATPVTVSDFNLNATWTYLENTANNPVPVMVEQSANVWVVAMYQGTSAVFGVSQNYGAGMVPTVAATSTGCVATAGNEAGIIVTANTVGTDVITYHLVNPQAGAPVTATAITIAVNVVPAAPGTGNGVMTNVSIAPAQSAAITQSVSQTDAQKTQEMLKLINAERAKLGRGPLTINSEIQAVTDRRAKEIYNDFRHNGTGSIDTDTIGSNECITKITTSIGTNTSNISASRALNNFKKSSVHWNVITGDTRCYVGISFYKNCCVVTPGFVKETDDDWSWAESYD